MDTKKLRQKILDLAIRGKLVPQDPNDEPASVLLERIRAEKERLIKEGKIKRSKKSTSDTPHYGNEAPFEVPESWEWCTIDDIAESNIGLTYKPSDISNDGVPVYRSNNIQNRSICLDDVVRVDTQILEKQYLHESDLLICARNGSRNLVGKCALIPSLSEPTTFGAFMAVCRSSYNKWIFLLLNSDYFDAYLDDSNSTAINQVTQKMLLAFQMPFPPANEQDRIYNEVCKWFSVIDSLEIEERDLNLSIEKAKFKILELAIHGKLVPQDPNDEPAIELLKRINPSFVPCDNGHSGKMPEGWIYCNLKDVANIQDNKRCPIKTEERNKRSKGKSILYPYYGATGIAGYIDDFLLDGKYILLGEDGAPFLDKYAKKAYETKGKIWVNNHVHILEPQINFSYLLHYLNTVDYSYYVKGTTRLKLTQSDMSSIKVLLPPLSEQQRIATKIEEIFAVLNEIQKSIED